MDSEGVQTHWSPLCQFEAFKTRQIFQRNLFLWLNLSLTHCYSALHCTLLHASAIVDELSFNVSFLVISFNVYSLVYVDSNAPCSALSQTLAHSRHMKTTIRLTK